MMKKVYRKPEIMFEHLELDNAISACDYMVAADCQEVTPDNGKEEIPYDVVDTIDGGVNKMIYSAFSVCESSEECYHVPVFKSRVEFALS